MTRAFTGQPVAPGTIDTLIDFAGRAPSAGNTAATQYLILEGADEVGGYWDITLPPEHRVDFAWPELWNAPVLIMPFVDPVAYVTRYAEKDKVHTGLGASAESWSTPYWWVDGGMAAMIILLGVEDLGLGALLFGLFDHEAAVKTAYEVPESMRALGTIAVGYPATDQRPSTSTGRSRRSTAQVQHRGSWRSHQPR